MRPHPNTSGAGRIREIAAPIAGVRAYRTASGCVVLVGLEPAGWHLSISHPSRYPTWDEIADARYELVPDGAHMAMLLPPRAEYVALHPTTMHLHEIGSSEDHRP
jgi:hypothetical protein